MSNDTSVRALSAQIAACAAVRAHVGTAVEKLSLLHECARVNTINELSLMTTDFAQLLIFLGFEVAREQAAQVSTLENELALANIRIETLERQSEFNDSLIASLEANVEAKEQLIDLFAKQDAETLPPLGTQTVFSSPDLTDEQVDALFGHERGSGILN